MKTSVQIQESGSLSLPEEIRTKYGIRDGDALNIIDLEGTLVLSPITPNASDLAAEIEQIREEAGITIQELLADLRDHRDKTIPGPAEVKSGG